ncbi:hypothetical protein ACA910_004466 [Epithemia clementina (nom. ined.)]
MRRSKALPSKTVRNYRSVSQRRMITTTPSTTTKTARQHDDDDDEEDRREMKRLQKLLLEHDPTSHAAAATTGDDDEEEEEEEAKPNPTKTMNTKNLSNSHDDDDTLRRNENSYYDKEDDLVVLPNRRPMKKVQAVAVVELTESEQRAAQLLNKQRRRKLQQLEQRHAQKERRQVLYDKLQQSALTETQRSLLVSHHSSTSKRLVLRRLLQKERAGLALTNDEQDLLYTKTKSSRRLEEEPDPTNVNHDDSVVLRIAHTDTRVPENNQHEDGDGAGDGIRVDSVTAATSSSTTNSNEPPPTMTIRRKRKRKKRIWEDEQVDESEEEEDKNKRNVATKDDEDETAIAKNAAASSVAVVVEKETTKDPMRTTTTTETNKKETKPKKPKLDDDNDDKSDSSTSDDDDNDNDNEPNDPEKTNNNNTAAVTDAVPATSSSSSSSFAAQMMASLTALKAQQQQQQEARATTKTTLLDEQDEIASSLRHIKSYQPTAPIQLQITTRSTTTTTTTTGGNENAGMAIHRPNLPPPLHRPPKVQEARYELPAAALEFEIVDTIQHSAVTILCGETGSGKSTQVPQFLYEAGLTMRRMPSSNNNNNNNETTDASQPRKSSSQQQHFKIGITQPRRVAAVSTAKRVCYEMGHGNGQSIRSLSSSSSSSSNDGTTGNLVAYQTRYETAGLGTATHLKFMTDGILLQEIQADLLLRQYSVICIDEAHERNLNSDALIGLLSVALPLRQQAADACLDGTLPPLKVVIMSATLRVTDFTDNAKLFAAASLYKKPAVLNIPGRNFPVTVHHNKTTVLEQYEDAAFSKICKIHRQLPSGGILVFLTGQQEIVRMVRRLQKALGGTRKSVVSSSSSTNAQNKSNVKNDDAVEPSDEHLRDMDDDELDGELFLADYNATEEEEKKEQDSVNKSPVTLHETGPDSHDTAATTTAQQACTNDGDDNNDKNNNNGMPDKVVVLPLYSMLSTEKQAKVFEPVPDGHRLIVVATNIAETSITIPGISYVVDTGRQKCRNYNTGTGVASYDIMWISKASADQRAGRAGRTGPGHCYRLYSSSMYGRHMDDFALPEVLTRPLEDVVLAMKAMRISNVADFPFPTPPGKDQLEAATKLLANLGCIDLNKTESIGTPGSSDYGDGEITRLGAAVAKLPLGVRYGKMLLVAAEAGVLDYAIVMVALLSESSPFVVHGQQVNEDEMSQEKDSDSTDDDNDDEPENGRVNNHNKKKLGQRWSHRGGDILAGVLAVGAYTYAGRGAGGMAEKVACRKFCEEHGLNPVVMARIQKMRTHLARLARTRLSNADGIAAKTGGFLSSMKPPNKLQEQLLCQAIASGLLDHVAMLAPLGSIPQGNYSFSLRSAYLSCTSNLATEPLWIDRNSVVYSRDPRHLPKWICYDSVERKITNDGTPIATVKRITPIEPSWLGSLAQGSRLLKLGDPLPTPVPKYDEDQDRMVCSVQTKFGHYGWEISPVQVEMYPVVQKSTSSSTSGQQHFLSDDSFRWFARYLLEGKVLPEFQEWQGMWNEQTCMLTRKTPSSKAALLVAALANAGVDSAAALRKHWAEVNPQFLYKELIPSWISRSNNSTTGTTTRRTGGIGEQTDPQIKELWTKMVKRNIQVWKDRHGRPDSDGTRHHRNKPQVSNTFAKERR